MQWPRITSLSTFKIAESNIMKAPIISISYTTEISISMAVMCVKSNKWCVFDTVFWTTFLVCTLKTIVYFDQFDILKVSRCASSCSVLLFIFSRFFPNLTLFPAERFIWKLNETLQHHSRFKIGFFHNIF